MRNKEQDCESVEKIIYESLGVTPNNPYYQAIEDEINNLLNMENQKPVKTNKTKVKEICKMKLISSSTLQRCFLLSYPKAVSIIDDLIKEKIVKEKNHRCKILNKKRLSLYLKQLFVK